MSIENGFTNMTGRTAGGFSANIIGQVNYVNDLQQGVAIGAPGTLTTINGNGVQGQLGSSGQPTPDQVVQRMRADPNFEQQAISAVKNNPQLLKQAVMELAKRPDLARALPKASKQFLINALTQRGL